MSVLSAPLHDRQNYHSLLFVRVVYGPQLELHQGMFLGRLQNKDTSRHVLVNDI